MRKTPLTIIGMALSCIMGCQPTAAVHTPKEPNTYSKLLEKQGWLENYKKGARLLQELSALGPERRLDTAAHRGERLAFVGVAAPPGSTNDLITGSGFYIRVVNKQGIDLRPQAAWWEVLVCGEVRQVLAENKLIVLEVDETGWLILQAG